MKVASRFAKTVAKISAASSVTDGTQQESVISPEEAVRNDRKSLR